MVASDGVWDHWPFDQAIAELVPSGGGLGAVPITSRAAVIDFFESTRLKGEEAFGDGADNLTGIVAILPHPNQMAEPAAESQGTASAAEDFGA